MIAYNPRDWYWQIRGETRVYSSARTTFVPINDAIYTQWRAQDNRPTIIANEAELWAVLAAQYPEGLPTGNVSVTEAVREVRIRHLNEAVLRVLLNLENRIRVLEQRPAITQAQLVAVIRNLL